MEDASLSDQTNMKVTVKLAHNSDYKFRLLKELA